MEEKELFNRSQRLLGAEGMENLSRKRVILFGVGGVGSWCAESLVRTGLTHLTIVDSDYVCVTNCNRQLMATTKTIGQVKVEALKNRLLEINPQAEIIALQKVYTKETAEEFHLETYDYIIDAIDSLKDKADLILHACQMARERKNVTFLSSMGAALRVDPTKVRVDEFWNIKGDALARALRNRFKRNKEFPAHKFKCVYSEETPLENKGTVIGDQSQWSDTKAQINGSLSHITGIFGMTLAGLVIKDIVTQTA